MVACALGALALTAVGCGVQEHANEPRPQPPTRVSVAISDDAVSVQPSAIGIGPDRARQIPQNKNVPQPRVRANAPLTVVFVATNLTDFDSRLEVRGPRDASSQPLVANGNVTLQADLPTGVYTIAAADIPAAGVAKLTVGPYRSSSENDVLLP